jgi:hypothetical protein
MEAKMDALGKILADARQSREEALGLLSDVTAGTAQFVPDMSRDRALEVLNGCLEDYNSIITRLNGRHRG